MTKKNKGFTLIEMLVSLTLISFVVVIAVGLLMTTNARIRQTRHERRVMDNLTFALEHMSRSISYGRDYSCFFGGIKNSCPFSVGGSNVISIQGTYLGVPSLISYERQINTNTGRGYISRSIGSANGVSLTDEAIDIEELTFYVYHAEPYAIDPEQPRVVISIRGTSYASRAPRPFQIQTTLSQRDLKLQ